MKRQQLTRLSTHDVYVGRVPRLMGKVVRRHDENINNVLHCYTDCNKSSRTDKLKDETMLDLAFNKNLFDLYCSYDSRGTLDISLKLTKHRLSYSNLYVSENFRKKINKLSISYKYTMEDFSIQLDKWLELRWRNIQNLQKTIRHFHLIKRTLSSMVLISSSLEVATGIAACMYRYFHCTWSLEVPFIIAGIAGSVSITGCLMALSYSKHALEDILQNFHEEIHIFENLKRIHTRGNFIDDKVLDLFPHGVDMSLIQQDVLNADDQTWKAKVSSAIIQSTIRKSKKFVIDKKFLTSVKAFVESPAALMWLKRLKIRKLLDEICSSLLNHPYQKSICDVFKNQTVLNVYPVPEFYDNGSTEKTKFLCSSMAAVLVILKLVVIGSDDFEAMEIASRVLIEDYEQIRRASQDLLSEYD